MCSALVMDTKLQMSLSTTNDKQMSPLPQVFLDACGFSQLQKIKSSCFVYGCLYIYIATEQILTSLAAYVYKTLFFITNHICFQGFLLPFDLCK